tara:strand:+ start:325 stop:651 length:327 start_codon:yes stop_codon:yes gene_type:complete
MNRRGFLAALGASVAAAAMPSYSIADSGVTVIRDQTIILDKPLYLKGKAFIDNCTFKASKDFVGDTMIVVCDGAKVEMNNCCLSAKHVNWGGASFPRVNFENCSEFIL